MIGKCARPGQTSSCSAVTVAVRLDAVEEACHARLGSKILHLRGNICISPSGTNELLIEGAEIDLFFATDGRSPLRDLWAGFILDDNSQSPSIMGVKGRYF